MFCTLVFEDYDHSTVANTAGKFWCMHATPSLLGSFVWFCFFLRFLSPHAQNTESLVCFLWILILHFHPSVYFLASFTREALRTTRPRIKDAAPIQVWLTVGLQTDKWLCKIKNKKKTDASSDGHAWPLLCMNVAEDAGCSFPAQLIVLR